MTTVIPRSDFAREIVHVYAIITWAAAGIALLVFAVLAVVLVRFRAGPGAPLPAQTRGHTLLELGWTIAPALVLLVISIPTLQVIFRTQAAPPAQALEVTVLGPVVVGVSLSDARHRDSQRAAPAGRPPRRPAARRPRRDPQLLGAPARRQA